MMRDIMKDLKAKSALDLKKLSKTHVMENLTKHLNTYEKRIRVLVNDLDLRSRDAREKSRDRIEHFADQIKQTREVVEKRVNELLHTEGKRLNQSVNELVKYLKTVAKSEKLSSSTPRSRKSAGKRSTSGARNAAKKTTRTKAKKSSVASASQAASSAQELLRV